MIAHGNSLITLHHPSTQSDRTSRQSAEAQVSAHRGPAVAARSQVVSPAALRLAAADDVDGAAGAAAAAASAGRRGRARALTARPFAQVGAVANVLKGRG